jgi:O-antigen/teichoic acid export membrane protein
MSNVRVTYSGLIAFVVAIIGVITGTIFVIMVTRKLSPEEFGLWTLIGSLVGYVTIVEPIVTYWTTRQIARGERVGKTALSTSGMFSVAGIIAYFGIALFVSYSLGADLTVLLIASFLIPLTFLTNILNSISLGHQPQNVSYGSLAFEITKIPLGIIFVVLLQFGIIGALIATIGSSIIRIILLVIMTKEHISGIIDKKIIKFWLKMSWLTVYQSSYGFIYKLDVLVFSVMTGSLVGLAYWGAAATVSNLVVHSRNISQGLYPKLLATSKNEIAEENFKRTMYFAIPLLGATILFAKPVMYVLNPLYVDGYYIAILITLRSFANMIMGFFFTILESFEKVDLDKQSHFKKYIKSNLFLNPTMLLTLSGIYVGGLAIFLFSPITDNMNEIELVTIWSYILLSITIVFMMIGIILVKKRYGISIPIKEISKYGIATLIASLFIYYITENYLEYTESVYDFIPQILPIITFGGLIYFGITYLIDNSTKKLFKSVFKEITKKIR